MISSTTIRFSLLAGAMSMPYLLWTGCERHADIRDEPEDTFIVEMPTIEAGPLPVVDSGLESDANTTCTERPIGDCVGSNDFLCGFDKWTKKTITTCNQTTGCKTNGWLEVYMGGDGCVHEIRMDQPNDDMIACLVAEFSAVRCPCGIVSGSHYFGVGNNGVCPTP